MPSQDIVLGSHYLTVEPITLGTFRYPKFYFNDFNAVFRAYENEQIGLQSSVWFRWDRTVGAHLNIETQKEWCTVVGENLTTNSFQIWNF